MASVTNIIIHAGVAPYGLGNYQGIREMMVWFNRQGNTSFALEMDLQSSKMWNANIFIATACHLDVTQFLERMASFSWGVPGQVQIYLKHEEDERFTEYRI